MNLRHESPVKPLIEKRVENENDSKLYISLVYGSQIVKGTNYVVKVRLMIVMKFDDNVYGDSVQEHIKVMTETFDALSVVGDHIEEEDRVVHLLASLPDSFNVLVTALEASVDVPKMEVVTERLLHEERKLRDRDGESNNNDAKALTGKQFSKGKGPKCHYCGRFGHIKRNCRDFNKCAQSKDFNKESKKVGYKHKANKARVKRQESSSDSESD
ncbi:gag-pol poly [Labeo rohita]|uniref:Gag-pol poly n=1 Tax=Labeo rohita TaxID=84645 RepID=A0A498LU31_LABRO|nr:gag-pol poly [Labeo rohita]